VIASRPFAALLIAALAFLAPASAPAKPSGGKEPFVSTSQGGERIVSYRSDIDVGRDSSLHVTETIRVDAEGDNIRHGIYRDFPTRYERDGRTVRVGFTVEGVELDGRAVPWSRESIGNGVRVKIGDADVDVPPGEHVYTIRYATTRQLNFSNPAFDELYWNVTGNGWLFPIDSAEVRVHLPQPVQFGETNLYTGPQGSTAHNAELVSTEADAIAFRTTQPLGPYEGFTVSVTWPKGVIPPPPPPSAFSQWMQDYGPLAAGLLALAALAGFYFYAWLRAGRGPIPGTVVPLFSPPEGMSAAAVRYVRRMRFDNRCYAAAIVDSGVHGKIRLVEGESGFFGGKKTRIEKTAEPDDMAPPERAMLRALFVWSESIEMDKKNHAAFGKAKSGLQDGLAEAYKGKLFLTNLGWAWAGLWLMLAAMMLVGGMLISADPFADPGDGAVAWLGLGLFLVALGLAPRARRSGAGGWIALIVSILAGLAGLFLLVGMLALADSAGLVLPILSPLLALPLVMSAFWWMAAPTKEGRSTMDSIAGFQKYLSVTEENRLEVLHPPEKTPELFERYLPYAIALGVENRWAARFAGVLAAAAADPNRSGHTGMGWYVGSQSPWSDPGRFAGAVGGALASSVASAATAPGSSSGSGGGGFSGGGGGGGGGGGW
jgi:uncharacterized membrane protein YgcG